VDRHLLPDEIDLLLDGEVGFGTTPLKAHVRGCEHCRRELEEARKLVRVLEHLPHFAPAVAFASRVMARVQVFVPWHVTLLDTLRGWMPRSRPAQLLAGSGLASVAAVFTLATLWLLSNLDSALFAGNLALTRLRGAVLGGIGDTVAALLGEPARDALSSGGTMGLLAAATLLLLLTALATRVVRALSTSRTR
jgi:hypothetical protein